jgi:hypothetical protein
MSSAVLINGGATRQGMPGSEVGSDSLCAALKLFASRFSRHAAECRRRGAYRHHFASLLNSKYELNSRHEGVPWRPDAR